MGNAAYGTSEAADPMEVAAPGGVSPTAHASSDEDADGAPAMTQMMTQIQGDASDGWGGGSAGGAAKAARSAMPFVSPMEAAVFGGAAMGLGKLKVLDNSPPTQRGKKKGAARKGRGAGKGAPADEDCASDDGGAAPSKTSAVRSVFDLEAEAGPSDAPAGPPPVYFRANITAEGLRYVLGLPPGAKGFRVEDLRGGAAPSPAADANCGGADGNADAKSARMVLCPTGLMDEGDEAALREFAAAFGAEVVTEKERVAEATHCVCGKVIRSYKYLHCVVSGKWVVSMEWARRSLEAGELLPPGDFEMRGTGKVRDDGAPRTAREHLAAGGAPLFSRCAVHIKRSVSANTSEVVPEDHCRRLLEAGGAELVPTRQRIEQMAAEHDGSEGEKHFLVLSTGKRLGWKGSGRGRYCLVSSEWLVDVCAAFHLALPTNAA